MRALLGYTRCPHSRAALEAEGVEVWTCDLRPDPHPHHLQCDIWEVAPDPAWDFGIFHPMCTYANVASAWAFADPDFDRYPGVGYHQRVKPGTLVGAARRAERAKAVLNVERLDRLPYPTAIENPAPSQISSRYRAPDQVVHPYQFGDDASKGTGFWLDQLPPLEIDPSQRVSGRLVQWKGKTVERWANQTDSGQNRLTPSETRWLDRSDTYPGIAAAFAQWARYMKGEAGQMRLAV